MRSVLERARTLGLAMWRPSLAVLPQIPRLLATRIDITIFSLVPSMAASQARLSSSSSALDFAIGVPPQALRSSLQIQVTMCVNLAICLLVPVKKTSVFNLEAKCVKIDYSTSKWFILPVRIRSESPRFVYLSDLEFLLPSFFHFPKNKSFYRLILLVNKKYFRHRQQFIYLKKFIDNEIFFYLYIFTSETSDQF